MLYPIFGMDNTAPSTGATNYNFINACRTSGWQASDPPASIPLAGAVDITNFTMTLTNQPGSGKSYAFTLMKNGSTTAVTVTIANTATSATYSGAAVSWAQGDTISL